MAKAAVLDEQRIVNAVPARAVESVDDSLAQMHQSIMQRAYELFEAHGAQFTRELDDWLNAERELFWQPAATVREHDDALEVSIAMPGLKPDEVEVQVTAHEVLVQSSCGVSESGECKAVHADELPRGRAFRVIKVSSPLDAERAEASLRDGLLKITVPLATEAAARTVPVAA